VEFFAGNHRPSSGHLWSKYGINQQLRPATLDCQAEKKSLLAKLQRSNAIGGSKYTAVYMPVSKYE